MITLYHGSNVSIEQIDLSLSRKGKDFDNTSSALLRLSTYCIEQKNEQRYPISDRMPLHRTYLYVDGALWLGHQESLG